MLTLLDRQWTKRIYVEKWQVSHYGVIIGWWCIGHHMLMQHYSSLYVSYEKKYRPVYDACICQQCTLHRNLVKAWLATVRFEEQAPRGRKLSRPRQNANDPAVSEATSLQQLPRRKLPKKERHWPPIKTFIPHSQRNKRPLPSVAEADQVPALSSFSLR